MANGEITRALISCLNGNDLDSEKFFSTYPYTKSLEKALYELKNKGYLVVDERDNRILEIDATQKLIDLAKAIQ